MSGRGVLRLIEGALGFWCPGCEEMHVVNSGWTFNGDYDRLTFNPSVLVSGGHYVSTFKPGDDCWCTFNQKHPGRTRFKCSRCHSFVRDGEIQFLCDSTHALAGQTVRLKEPPCSGP